MAHLTDIDNVAPADSLKAGADTLNTWRERIDALNDILGDITAVEADQLENIAATTISAAQWGYLGVSTAAGGALLDDADASAQRTTLGLVIGTNVLAEQTIGIADDNLVEIDHASVADNDYAKFTANGLEGRSYSEVKTDLSLNSVENTALSTWVGSGNITTIGTVVSGILSTGAVLADVTMTLGSDVDADVYYRASNKLTRLAKGTASQVLTMNAGETAPEWAISGGAASAIAYLGL